MKRARRERGLVLVVVVFFIALLMASVATFLRRATVDASIAHNRDEVARAEALARGGIRLGEALLIEDLRLEEEEGLPRESLQDVWAQASSLQLPLAEDESLHLEIEDSGARLNLNALFIDEEDPQQARERKELFLVEVLRKVIDEMQVRPEQKNFDPVELARNLIDWIDKDEARKDGSLEDDYYQRQQPPYRAPNGPLLSLDELRLVQGFNGLLVEALRPYLGVFPLVPAKTGGGINPNTAPPWVLALMYYGDVGDQRLAPEDDVRHVLKEREEALLCPDEIDDARCVSLRVALRGEDPNLYPPVSFSSNVFRIVAEARVRDVQRRIEAVIDRGLPSQPLRLAWRTQ